MSAPRFASVDHETCDLLSLVSDGNTILGQLRLARFLEACKSDADTHDGIVSVNRVRALLTIDGELQIDPRAFSGLWSTNTGPGKAMVKTGSWIVCEGSGSGNDGRPYPERRWVA